MRSLQRFISLAVVLLLVPPAARADTVTLVASRDTTIYQGNPSNSNGAGQAMFAGNTGGRSASRALLGFEIAGNIPAGSTITGVQLTLVLARTSGSEFSARQIQLRRLLANWGEGTAGRGSATSNSGQGFFTLPDGTTATWTHRLFNSEDWANPGGDFAGTASGSTMVGTIPNVAYTWDSTAGMISDVQSWLDNPATNFGWILLGDESEGSTARIFWTREAATNNRPALTVTFTPPARGATRLAVSAPANVIAGFPFDVTVTALDNDGNVVPGYTGTVTFSSSDPHPAALPADYTFTAGDSGTHTFSGLTALFTAGTQTVTVQDKSDATIMGSATVPVVAARADHFVVTAPPTAVSGTPFDVTVTALDPYGNVDTNYAGMITWASNDTDPKVVLPPDYPFLAIDNGTHTFPAGVTLITIGDQVIAVADTVSAITGGTLVSVGPGP